MYCNIKTLKTNDPARAKASGCSTPVESLPIFVEKEIHNLAEPLPSRIKDTNGMLNIMDNLNNNCIAQNAFIITFNIVNMFARIHIESGIKSVKRLFNFRCITNPPNLCILGVLRHVWNGIFLYLTISSLYKRIARRSAPICLVIIVILLWQCMMRK